MSLFQELSSSPSPSSCLPLVRSIKNKLIGSELNKRVVLSQELDLVLLHLLRDVVDEDQSTHAELRLELMTALASLAANHREGADRLLQHDFLALVLQAVRGGVRGMQESGVRALKHIVSSCSPQLAAAVVELVLERVDVVSVLVQGVRQWQAPLSELSAEVLIHLCLTLEHRLCLIQHGLLTALLSHLAARRPPSSASFAVPAAFLASLRLLCSLCTDNLYAVVFLSSPPSSSASPFAGLSAMASSLFTFLSPLLLHADPQVKLYSSSILLTSALVHLSLSRRGQRGGVGHQWVVHEEERWAKSELLRLHRDFHASPIGKRGRGGSEKRKKMSKDPDIDSAAFPLQPWIASLRPAIVAALSAASLPAPPAVQLLSSLLPRVLHVLTRLMESVDVDLVAAVYPLLTAAVDGNEACQEEVGQALPSLLQHLVHLTTPPPPTPTTPSPIHLVPVLHLLHALCAHETNRRVVLSVPAYYDALLSLISSAPQSPDYIAANTLRILARLSESHRFHLCRALADTAVIPGVVLALMRHHDSEVVGCAMRALAALLAPRTAQRRRLEACLMKGLITDVTDCNYASDVTAYLFAAAQGSYPQAVELLEQRRRLVDGAEEVATSWQSVRISALTALSAWSCRSSLTTQQTIVQHMGGWKRLVGLLEERQTTDERALLIATLQLVKQLLASGAEHTNARDMQDFTLPDEGDEEKLHDAAATVVLSTADLALLLSSLSPLLSTHSSIPSPPISPSVADALIEVVLNASAHPSWTSTLLLSPSSSPLLAFLLYSLRSPRSANREAAACALTNALLTLANEWEEELERERSEDVVDDTKPHPNRRDRQPQQPRDVRGKRRRSVSRRKDPAVGDRRKRRGAATEGGGASAAVVDVDEEKSDDDDARMNVERISAALQRFASSGLLTQLSHMRRQEEDQAVVERVKRILLLLQLLLQLINPPNPTTSSTSISHPTTTTSTSSAPPSSMLDDLRGIDLDLPPSPTLHIDDATLDAVLGDRVSDSPSSLQRIMARMREMGWRAEVGAVTTLDSDGEDRKEGEEEGEEDEADDDEDVADDAELLSYPSSPPAPRSDVDGVGELPPYPPALPSLSSLSSLSIPWLHHALPSRLSLSSRLDSFMRQLRQVGRADHLRHAPSSNPLHTLSRSVGGGGGGGEVGGEGAAVQGGESERGGVSRQFREAVQLLDRRHRQIRAVADALGLAPDRLRLQRRRQEDQPRPEDEEGMEQ